MGREDLFCLTQWLGMVKLELAGGPKWGVSAHRPRNAGFQHGAMVKQTSTSRAGGRRSGGSQNAPMFWGTDEGVPSFQFNSWY
jgi:hypothetical protein